MRIALVLGLALVVLTACGPMPAATPTTTPATPPAAVETATPGTPATGGLTLGDLAARVNAAWSGVTSYRSVFTAQAMTAPAGTPVATPLATPGATPVGRSAGEATFVREVILPDRQRQVVTGLGPNDHEAIATSEGIYIRGPLAGQIAPGTPDDVWIALDPPAIGEDSLLSQLLGGLPQLPPPPLASLPERLQPQELRELGEVEVDGRTCTAYGAANTVTATGMRIDYTIAVDDQDLPCFIETSTGGKTQGREEFQEIGGDFTIDAPAAATPASVPPALATPVAHD